MALNATAMTPRGSYMNNSRLDKGDSLIIDKLQQMVLEKDKGK